MMYNSHPYGHALDADALNDDDLDESDLNESDVDSADASDSNILLNGMKILFDKAVPVSPVNLLPKPKRAGPTLQI